MAAPIRQTVTIDGRQAVAALDDIGDASADAAKAIDRVDDTEITVDTDAALAELARLDRESKELAARKVEIRAELDATGVTDGAAKAKAGVDDLDDSLKRTAGTAPSSAGALRDVSGALGGTGTAALDAGEGIMGLGETIGQLSPRLAGVGAAIGQFGFLIGGAVLAVNVADKAFNALTGATKRYGAAVAALNIERGVAQVEALGQAVKAARDEINTFSLEGGGRGLLQAFSLGSARNTPNFLKEVTRELDKLTKTNPDAARALVDTLIDMGDASGLTSLEIAGLNSRLSDVSTANNQLARSSEILRNRQLAQAAATDRSADAADDARDAYERYMDAQRDGLDALRSSADANKQLRDALADLADTLDDTEASSADVEEAALRYARAMVDAEEAARKARGSTLSAAEASKVQTDALLQTARTAKGEARDAILRYVADLNGIPTARTTELLADADLNDVEQFRRAIDSLDNKTIRVWVDFRDRATGGRIPRPGVPDGYNGASTASSTAAALREYQRLNGTVK